MYKQNDNYKASKIDSEVSEEKNVDESIISNVNSSTLLPSPRSRSKFNELGAHRSFDEDNNNNNNNNNRFHYSNQMRLELQEKYERKSSESLSLSDVEFEDKKLQKRFKKMKFNSSFNSSPLLFTENSYKKFFPKSEIIENQQESGKKTLRFNKLAKLTDSGLYNMKMMQIKERLKLIVNRIIKEIDNCEYASRKRFKGAKMCANDDKLTFIPLHSLKQALKCSKKRKGKKINGELKFRFKIYNLRELELMRDGILELIEAEELEDAIYCNHSAIDTPLDRLSNANGKQEKMKKPKIRQQPIDEHELGLCNYDGISLKFGILCELKSETVEEMENLTIKPIVYDENNNPEFVHDLNDDNRTLKNDYAKLYYHQDNFIRAQVFLPTFHIGPYCETEQYTFDFDDSNFEESVIKRFQRSDSDVSHISNESLFNLERENDQSLVDVRKPRYKTTDDIDDNIIIAHILDSSNMQITIISEIQNEEAAKIYSNRQSPTRGFYKSQDTSIFLRRSSEFIDDIENGNKVIDDETSVSISNDELETLKNDDLLNTTRTTNDFDYELNEHERVSIVDLVNYLCDETHKSIEKSNFEENENQSDYYKEDSTTETENSEQAVIEANELERTEVIHEKAISECSNSSRFVLIVDTGSNDDLANNDEPLSCSVISTNKELNLRSLRKRVDEETTEGKFEIPVLKISVREESDSENELEANDENYAEKFEMNTSRTVNKELESNLDSLENDKTTTPEQLAVEKEAKQDEHTCEALEPIESLIKNLNIKFENNNQLDVTTPQKIIVSQPHVQVSNNDDSNKENESLEDLEEAPQIQSKTIEIKMDIFNSNQFSSAVQNVKIEKQPLNESTCLSESNSKVSTTNGLDIEKTVELISNSIKNTGNSNERIIISFDLNFSNFPDLHIEKFSKAIEGNNTRISLRCEYLPNEVETDLPEVSVNDAIENRSDLSLNSHENMINQEQEEKIDDNSNIETTPLNDHLPFPETKENNSEKNIEEPKSHTEESSSSQCFLKYNLRNNSQSSLCDVSEHLIEPLNNELDRGIDMNVDRDDEIEDNYENDLVNEEDYYDEEEVEEDDYDETDETSQHEPNETKNELLNKSLINPPEIILTKENSNLDESIDDNFQYDETNEEDQTETDGIRKPRPGYIIQKNCHIFGGADEEEDDEFFVSSGAIYQSWPYIYEPGFKLVPIIEMDEIYQILSKSDNYVDYNETEANEAEQSDNNDETKDTEILEYKLPEYSLKNFDINLLHVNSNKKRKKKRRKAHHTTSNENINNEQLFSSSSSAFQTDSDTDSDSSDDSESIREYKQRHAIGFCRNFNMMNQNANIKKVCSNLNLPYTNSVDGNDMNNSGNNLKVNTVHDWLSLKANRLTNSYEQSNLTHPKRAKFFSENRLYVQPDTYLNSSQILV